jgi:hypothetical protein
VQGPVRRLAGAVEQATAEQDLYLARAKESEASGIWNEEVRSVGMRAGL